MAKESTEIYACGRIELCGNHTDHQGGHVLATAIHMKLTCTVVKVDGNICLSGEGGVLSVSLDELSPDPSEYGSSTAIVRGVLATFERKGWAIGGFEGEIMSTLPVGKGLSSSAAFGVLIGRCLNELYNGSRISAMDIAKAAQEAENVYFGKPCGLLDQCICSHEGTLLMDFNDTDNPKVEVVERSLTELGLTCILLDTEGSHSDLTSHYADITNEMRSVAEHFGENRLCEVDEDSFFAKLPNLKTALPERALLRAIHYYDEDSRTKSAYQALKAGDTNAFLDCIAKSGLSSQTLLQNIYPDSTPKRQTLNLAIEIAKRLVGDNGAVRVHGGGFGGTILAVVKSGYATEFTRRISEYYDILYVGGL